MRFLWVTEFPLLEYAEDQNRYVAMHPFTMPMDEDLELLETDPGKVRAKAYDIVLNGTEIGGGSVRIYQSHVQEKMFELLGFTKLRKDSDSFLMLSNTVYLLMQVLHTVLTDLLCLWQEKTASGKLLPSLKLKIASCLMTEAPGVIENVQLEELKIKLDISEE